MANSDTRNLIAVDVYVQTRKTRRYVGQLTREADKPPRYAFRYDARYLHAPFSIPLGPELPLTKREHRATELFPSFTERLPSPENPAYVEYLEKFHLSMNEKDPLVLLTTIGRAGPSSFLFEPVFSDSSQEDLKNFRSELGLTVRDFSTAFDIAVSSVTRIENGTAGREVLKRIELYERFPEAALFEVNRNASRLHENVKNRLLKTLGEKT